MHDHIAVMPAMTSKVIALRLPAASWLILVEAQSHRIVPSFESTLQDEDP